MNTSTSKHVMVVALCLIAGCGEATHHAKLPDLQKFQSPAAVQEVWKEYGLFPGELTSWERKGDGKWTAQKRMLEPVKTLKMAGTIRCLDFSDDDRLLACTSGGRVTVWDLTRNEVVAELEIHDVVQRVQFKDSRLYFQIGNRVDEDKVIDMWDLETRERRRVTRGLSFDLSPSGQLVVLRLSTDEIKSAPQPPEDEVEGLQVNASGSPTGSALADESVDKRHNDVSDELYVEVFSADDLSSIHRFPGIRCADLDGVGIRVTPDGHYAFGYRGMQCFVVDLHSRDLADSHHLRAISLSACVTGNNDAILAIARSGPGGQLFRYSFVDRTVTEIPGEINGSAVAVAFSIKRRLAGVACSNGDRLPSYLWVLNTDSTRKWRLTCHEHDICDVAFSSAGDLIATCGSDGRIHFWSLDGIVRRPSEPL